VRPRVAITTMPYVIGTAGHIDHGKTSLIKALTGQDTDRLKEEKERGISIDLGFAHLDLPDGTRAGVVDVPGHERFIRNMLAGAHGIDLVLFTVAADDGVMPQTEEHFDIIHLLGIEQAIFVITKSDLVSASRIAEVAEEIQILIAGTRLEHSTIVPFSHVTSHGLEAIRSHIARLLESRGTLLPRGYFRMPVDRVFVLQGHGLVVTGTAQSGEVKVGDRVHCLPGDHRLRVRSLQVHNVPMPSAAWGQRIALNLSGTDKASIARGDVICHEQLTLTSDRFDAAIEVRPSAARGIKTHQRVRLYVGTAERLGKLILLGSHDRVGPKQSAFCQVVLTEPVLALRGDRFIIRDETAQRTLGGGRVVHPWPRPHKRREPSLSEKLETLRDGALTVVVDLFLAERDDFAVPIGPLHQFLNVREEDARDLLHGMSSIRTITLDGNHVYTTESTWKTLQAGLVAALREFHQNHPLAPGRDMEELRDKLAGHIPLRLFRAFVEQVESEHVVARDGSLLRLPEYTMTLRDDERRLLEQISVLLGARPLSPPDIHEIERALGIGSVKLTELMRVLERQRSVVRVAPDLYFLPSSLDTVRRAFDEEFSPQGDITPAAFRDRFGTSRKYTIPLLEHFDREGVTVRVGDARRLKAFHA
jgi:selenocysteine-specific elongation factor